MTELSPAVLALLEDLTILEDALIGGTLGAPREPRRRVTLRVMSPFIRALLIGCVAMLMATAAGGALGFGPWAWFGLLVAMMLFTSLFDREGFYGPRGPR